MQVAPWAAALQATGWALRCGSPMPKTVSCWPLHSKGHKDLWLGKDAGHLETQQELRILDFGTLRLWGMKVQDFLFQGPSNPNYSLSINSIFIKEFYITTFSWVLMCPSSENITSVVQLETVLEHLSVNTMSLNSISSGKEFAGTQHYQSSLCIWSDAIFFFCQSKFKLAKDLVC